VVTLSRGGGLARRRRTGVWVVTVSTSLGFQLTTRPVR